MNGAQPSTKIHTYIHTHTQDCNIPGTNALKSFIKEGNCLLSLDLFFNTKNKKCMHKCYKL